MWQKKSTGTGIKNTNDRIKLLYGEEFGVSIKSNVNRGTIITIHLPFRRNQINAEQENEQ